MEELTSRRTEQCGDEHGDSNGVSSAYNAVHMGVSSRTKSPELSPRGTWTGTGIGFQPRNCLTSTSTHGGSDRESSPCAKGEDNGGGEGEREGNYGPGTNRVEREKFAIFEPEDADDASLCPAHCVQAVTTIIVDEGDMNPLKVRGLQCPTPPYPTLSYPVLRSVPSLSFPFFRFLSSVPDLLFAQSILINQQLLSGH